MTTIICVGFSLVGRPLTKANNNVIFLSNSAMHRADIDIFNIQMNPHENWDSKQFNSKSIDAILNFIEHKHLLHRHHCLRSIFHSQVPFDKLLLLF